MNIAITVWENRISPVFDAAGQLLVARIKDDRIIHREYQSFDPCNRYFLENFKHSGISVLICGAISKASANIIASTQIKLIAFVTGDADQILNLYLNGHHIPSDYFMPGCTQAVTSNGRL